LILLVTLPLVWLSSWYWCQQDVSQSADLRKQTPEQSA